jgi:hypothetical protein
MAEGSGVGPCPECGETGAYPWQLVCQGCFVPFALMPPARDDDADLDLGLGLGLGASPHPGPEAGPGPTAWPPPADPEAEYTRVFNLRPGTLSGAARICRDAPPQALRFRFPSGATASVESGARIRLAADVTVRVLL